MGSKVSQHLRDYFNGERSFSQRLLITFGLLIAFALSQVFYNLYLHPLSKYPGPILWRALRLPYIIALIRGESVHQIYKLHQEYGDVVRVAPNELSYAKTEAWQDIHCSRVGHKPFPRNPIWWGDFPGRTPSIVSTPSHAAHTRMRKLLNHCFSIKAVRGQEEAVLKYTDLMITKFREQMKENRSNRTVVNIVQWYMFLTFDILGELGFGESFNCLDRSSLHPWVQTIFNYFRIGAYIGALRTYLGKSIDRFLMKIVPKKTFQISTENYAWAVDKVHRRMNLETERDDFMTHILSNNDENGMTIPEIENNTNVLIIGGSETCGTVLSGTTNYLMKFPEAYEHLVQEVRTTFAVVEDINFASLASLPYLNAVIEEGLRMSPPYSAALQHQVPLGGDTICGEFIPENTHVGVHQWSLYRSPKKFYLPNHFLPERWLPSARSDPSSPFYNDDLTAVQAFSTGIWSCIGKQLAYAELRVILAKLIWNFNVKIADNGRNVDWEAQKSWFLIEKEPFDVELEDVR